MKALLIGGSGFIGSHIVDRLLARGHTVRVLDHRSEVFRETPSGVDLRVVGRDDTSAVAEALVGVDWVVHSASTTVPATSNLDPVADIETNLIKAVRLMQSMREASVRRILFLSSGGTVYGIPETPVVREDHPLRPISSYGVVKVAIENYLHLDQYLHGLRPLVLRPSNPYGPRQGLGGVQGVIGTFLRGAAQGKPLDIWGTGNVVRDFFHVGDLAKLCVACMEADITGTYNAGSGVGHSIRDVVEAVREVTGRELVANYVSGRAFDVPQIVLDIGAIQERVSWSPETTLRDGIEMTWDWIQTLPSEGA